MPPSILRTLEHYLRCWHISAWHEMSNRWRTRTLARIVAGVPVKSMRSQPIWPLCAMSKSAPGQSFRDSSIITPCPHIVVAPKRNHACWWCIRSVCCVCPAVHRITIFVRYQRCVATMRTVWNAVILRRSAKRLIKREWNWKEEEEEENERNAAAGSGWWDRLMMLLLRYRKTMWNLTCDQGFVGIMWNLNWCQGLYRYIYIYLYIYLPELLADSRVKRESEGERECWVERYSNRDRDSIRDENKQKKTKIIERLHAKERERENES